MCGGRAYRSYKRDLVDLPERCAGEPGDMVDLALTISLVHGPVLIYLRAQRGFYLEKSWNKDFRKRRCVLGDILLQTTGCCMACASNAGAAVTGVSVVSETLGRPRRQTSSPLHLSRRPIPCNCCSKSRLHGIVHCTRCTHLS